MDITRTAGSVTSSVLTETLKVGRGLVSFCRRKPLGGAGVVVLASLVMIAILAPWISPYDTDETFRRAVFAPPSKDFPLGGDRVGHDVMSRLFNGARVSLRVGVISVGIGVTLGSLMGVISGYFGGKFDLIFQRFVDAFIAFPGIILALALMAALGSSERNVVIALIVVLSPAAIRTVRSQALAVKELEYVLAARAIGASNIRIILRHMVPNVMAIFIILCTLNLGYAIVVEASLSFLGAGVPPDIPTWGSNADRRSGPEQHRQRTMAGHFPRPGSGPSSVRGEPPRRCETCWTPGLGEPGKLSRLRKLYLYGNKLSPPVYADLIELEVLRRDYPENSAATGQFLRQRS